MPESINVKVQPINAEAFRPYGQLLDKQLIFPEVEPGAGRVAMELKHVQPRPDTKQMRQLAIHFSYNQTFITLEGTMVMVVAPPPRNREAGQEAYEFNYDQVSAFVVKPGQVFIIDKGVWHNNFWIGKHVSVVNVTRKDPGEGTTKDAFGRPDVTHTRRPYVEFVDLEKRYNRVIDLDFSDVQDLVKA